MSCDRLDTGNGVHATICNRGKKRPYCSVPGCDRPAGRQCDFPIPKKKSGTCDANLCQTHAATQGEELDYCPPHAARGQGSLPL